MPPDPSRSPTLFHSLLETVEARWFGQGAASKDILAWFRSLPGEADDQPARYDLYLQPIADNGLSVKLREGGLEIKQRHESLGRFRFGRSAAGLVESWTKWRFPLDESSGSLPPILAGDRSWLSIEKKRRLKHYRLDKTGAVQTLPAQLVLDETAQPALHLELAEIRVGDQRWWTVGYEIVADGQPVLNDLLSVARHHLSEWDPGQLSESNSYGYPHWLAARSE